MSGLRQRLARIRMAETGERYTRARQVIDADPAEFARLREIDRYAQRRRRYPATDRDGLDGRHLLSAFETQRRKH